MTRNWEPGTQYNHGDIVAYDGHRYKIIQPHFSQGDWTPPVTPALWGKLQDEDHHDHHSHYQPPPQQQPQQPYAPPPTYNDGNHTNNQAPYQPEKPQQSGEKKDDHGLSKLGLFGGLAAAGVAAIGGVAAYKHHENKKDHAEWLADAERRTQQFHASGPTGPVTWILNRGTSIPQNAIVVGQEKTWTLYISRAFYKGTITPGKASNVFKKGAVIGYGHDEIPLDTYEILVGDPRGIKWVPASGKLNVAALGARPVDGGVDGDGTPLFVARAHHNGAVHPGKCSEKLNGAFIPYGGDEEEVANYEVLCYYN